MSFFGSISRFALRGKFVLLVSVVTIASMLIISGYLIKRQGVIYHDELVKRGENLVSNLSYNADWKTSYAGRLGPTISSILPLLHPTGAFWLKSGPITVKTAEPSTKKFIVLRTTRSLNTVNSYPAITSNTLN